MLDHYSAVQTREVILQTHRAENPRIAAYFVGGGNPDPKDKGPVVVEITMDGNIIRGSYYKGPKFQTPDAETLNDEFDGIDELLPLVERLLASGESFVTVTGEDDMVCALEWTIERAA